MDNLSQFIAETNDLPPVSLLASTAYQEHLKEMSSAVDEIMSSRPDIHELIGQNPLQVMYDNHRHHGAFMATVFAIGNYSLLAKTLPWVYRAYHAHNFSYDYFPIELKTWLDTLETTLKKEDISAIQAVYQWMISSHEKIIRLSQKEILSGIELDIDWVDKKNEFRSAVLRSDHKACLKMATSIVHTANDIEHFYLNILQPVLYEVGILWEKGEISVAQEHLASAIVSRVMVSANLIAEQASIFSGRAVVAASPNEFHEIGAAMISDVLEHDGWDIDYLGANVPQEDLLQHLRDFQPTFLALSATLPFNVEKIQSIISQIRQDQALKEIKVMVGGRVFNDNAELWKTIGADGFTANLRGARKLAQQWRES
ncbi:MAG: cobalamin-dependent protein [Desulfuromusa sp.]|jgi:methanogenic corrinoid protein MtbC1|nr:cobalamin-dependent protein [Desulfuromusa sp.]